MINLIVSNQFLEKLNMRVIWICISSIVLMGLSSAPKSDAAPLPDDQEVFSKCKFCILKSRISVILHHSVLPYRKIPKMSPLPEYKPPQKCLRASISPGLTIGILRFTFPCQRKPLCNVSE